MIFVVMRGKKRHSSSRRLSPAEFAMIEPLLKKGTSPEIKEQVKAVLIGGRPLMDVAEEYGRSRQALDHNVSVVWDTYKKFKEGLAAAGLAG